MRRSVPLAALPLDVQAKFRRAPTRRNAEPSRVAQFLKLLKEHGLPQPHREFKFAEQHGRKFRADFAWPAWQLLLEQEGGIFTRQAHGSITGLLRDLEKYNLAATLGYRVIRCVPAKLCTDEMLATIRSALNYHAP